MREQDNVNNVIEVFIASRTNKGNGIFFTGAIGFYLYTPAPGDQFKNHTWLSQG